MTLNFKTLCSSSAGNCLVIWTQSTKIIIDCGLGSMTRTHKLLTDNRGGPIKADAVLFSHMHTDHCSRYPLKVLQQYGLTIRVHESSIEQLKEKHCTRELFDSLKLKTFECKEFEVGDLLITPFEVPHQPEYKTCGFVIRHRGKTCWQKVVVATDFFDGEVVLNHFIDADFIYVESNHDLELLKQHPNPNSHYHMSNPKTAQLLCSAHRQSRKPPNAIMLGHISSQRNDPVTALKEVRNVFKKAGSAMDFTLCAAPLYESSKILQIL